MKRLGEGFGKNEEGERVRTRKEKKMEEKGGEMECKRGEGGEE